MHGDGCRCAAVQSAPVLYICRKGAYQFTGEESMAEIRAFRAVRPAEAEASAVAALPYDVYTREEAAAFVKDRPLSFLNIDRPETAFPPEHDMYADDVYAHAAAEYEAFKERGIFVTEDAPCYYVYELCMDGRCQTGVAALSSVDDYLNGVCKKHENTVAAKEQDRIRHVDTLSAQTGPIFLSYHAVPEISRLVEAAKQETPLYAFTSEDGIRHRVFRISDPEQIEKLTALFARVPCTYIADGHHRAASAVKAALSRREAAEKRKVHTEAECAAASVSAEAKENGRTEMLRGDFAVKKKAAHAGMTDAEKACGLPAGRHAYDYFLSVLFPDDQLKIYDYNRVVRDLNGHSTEEFLKLLEQNFYVTPLGAVESTADGKKNTEALSGEAAQPRSMCTDAAAEAEEAALSRLRPQRKYEIGMYLDGCMYRLQLKAEEQKRRAGDPVRSLDVSALQELVLSPLLGIGDPRTDGRIRFIGGIRGLRALKREADALTADNAAEKAEPAVAFAMYPTALQELFAVADAGKLMPPKSTWFEPKLRSGLFIHEIER